MNRHLKGKANAQPRPTLKARKHLWAAALAALAALAVSAAGCGTSPTPADAGVAAVDLSPIPAPAGLVAEAILPAPDAAWAKVRTTVGGPAMFMPAGAAALAATLLALPITIAAEIDGGLPILAASNQPDEQAPPRSTIGIHVKAGDRFVDQLTRGEGARFRARLDPATSITFLEPTDGNARLALGVLGNYLLVGADASDLTSLGPYVARTMSRAPVPKEDLAIDVPRLAIDGPLLKAARSFYDRVTGAAEKRSGSSAAFAPTIESWIEVLGDIDRARITVTLDDAARLRISGTPRPGGGAASRAIAELDVGDVTPLLELPADTLAGFIFRESAATRSPAVPRQMAALALVLGGELPAKERERFEGAIRAASDARGGWIAAGLRFDSAGPTAYLRAAVGDRAKLDEALGDLVGLPKVATFKALLADEGLKVSPSKTVVERLAGDTRRLLFERVEPPKSAAAAKGKPQAGAAPAGAGSPLPSSIELLYLLRDDGLFASVGLDPQEGLRRLVASPGGENLGGVEPIKAALAALGADASFALVVDPVRLIASRAGKPGSGAHAPVVLATGAGRAPDTLWARLDISNTAIRELVRYRGAFQ